MTVRIGINGLGAIGRAVLRATLTRPELGTVVAVNDLAPPQQLAYGLRHDSIRGPLPVDARAVGDTLVVGRHAIATFDRAEPGEIPWFEAGVDVVIDSTGQFRDGQSARRHIDGGKARKVIISASATDPDVVLVVGANEHDYDPTRHDVISPASCGVNALAVMAGALTERWSPSDVATTVILAQQGWQRSHDGFDTARGSGRLGRAAGQSVIPHDHVVGGLLEQVLPELGEIMFSFFCAPTPIGSTALLTARLDRPTSAQEINDHVRDLATGRLGTVLGVDDDDAVSIDVRGRSESVLIDLTGTRVSRDGRVVLRGWFDGVWGFGHRLLDLARLIGDDQLLPQGA